MLAPAEAYRAPEVSAAAVSSFALGLCFEDAALNGVGAQESSVSITTKHFRDCIVVHRKPLCDREQREAGFFTTLDLLAGVDATARTDRSLMSSAESGLSAVEAAGSSPAYCRVDFLVCERGGPDFGYAAGGSRCGAYHVVSPGPVAEIDRRARIPRAQSGWMA